MRRQWRLHKLLWNLSGGRVGRTVGGMPVVEVVTTGHRSGEPRQILIWYVEVEGVPAIIGTNAGLDSDPAWAWNLRAHPRARARWDGVWHDIVGVELEGEARESVWRRAVESNPGYQQTANSLTREVPIFRLEPR